MKRGTLIKDLATGLSFLYLSDLYAHPLLKIQSIPRTAPGSFKATRDLLDQYYVPGWCGVINPCKI